MPGGECLSWPAPLGREGRPSVPQHGLGKTNPDGIENCQWGAARDFGFLELGEKEAEVPPQGALQLPEEGRC